MVRGRGRMRVRGSRWKEDWAGEGVWVSFQWLPNILVCFCADSSPVVDQYSFKLKIIMFMHV